MKSCWEACVRTCNYCCGCHWYIPHALHFNQRSFCISVFLSASFFSAFSSGNTETLASKHVLTSYILGQFCCTEWPCYNLLSREYNHLSGLVSIGLGIYLYNLSPPPTFTPTCFLILKCTSVYITSCHSMYTSLVRAGHPAIVCFIVSPGCWHIISAIICSFQYLCSIIHDIECFVLLSSHLAWGCPLSCPFLSKTVVPFFFRWI